MRVRQAARTYIFKSALALLGLLALGPQRLSAQQQTATCTDWTNIASWSGTITLSGSGNSTDGTNTFTTSVQANISFTATPTNGSAGSCVPGSFPTWTAIGTRLTYSATIHDVETAPCGNGPGSLVDNFDVTNGTNQNAGLTLEMDFSNPNAPVYFFSLPGLVDGVVISYQGCGTSATYPQPPGYPWGPGFPSSVFPPPTSALLPDKISPLVGSATFQAYDATIAGGNSSWTVTWNIVPELDLAVAVTIPGYPNWRPTAGRTETDIGVTLAIEAEIRQKSTNQPAPLIVPDKWSFNLVDVSKEPGVAMNWPAKAAAAITPDMAFDRGLNLQFDPNLTFSPDDTIADINNPSLEPNPSHVLVFLVPHDWGGWATLNVTAVVNGVSIRGYLELQPPLVSETSQPNILLPRRQSGSSIADVWKENHGVPVGTPDNDDSESNPKGDGQPGDGLTLWEEYRGFYMGRFCKAFGPQPEGTPGANCVHVEGDPNAKDFFIVNQMGAEGVDGIGLFQFGSGLNVHYRGLTLAEIGVMDPNDLSAYRAINFNHSAGAHVVNEHAVILEWGSEGNETGASATIPTSDFSCKIPSGQCGLLPKHADHIEINPNLKTSPLVAKGGYQEITTEIAHELSHSVDVYHHGDGVDHYEDWSFDPNTGGVVSQVVDVNGLHPGSPTPITVVTEDQLFQSVIVGRTALELGLVDANGNPTPADRIYVGNAVCKGQVVQHGEHSGDALDFMRYDNARAYVHPRFSDVRVYVGYGEQNGVDLTDHPGGTGVNAPNRQPLPRYGDADVAHLRGNDRSQVDVNDSHTEIQRGQFVCQ